MNNINFKTKVLAFVMTTALGPLAAAQTLSSISVNPSSASSGQTVTVSVSVSDKCPSAGCVIALSSSNSTMAPIPASMTIPFDRKDGTKTFVAGSAAARTTITLSAMFNGVTKTTGSTFSVGPAVVAATPPPPPSGSIIATQTAAGRDGDPIYIQRGWDLATSYLYDAPETDPTGIRAKHNACMAANNGNGQLIAASGVIQKSKVSTGFGRANYTVEQYFTCSAGYSGWLSKITITAPGSNLQIAVGETAKFEACLIKPAPTGGAVAQVKTKLGHITVPTSITFAAGETCKSFTGTAVSGQFNVESIMVTLNAFRVTAFQSIK